MKTVSNSGKKTFRSCFKASAVLCLLLCAVLTFSACGFVSCGTANMYIYSNSDSYTVGGADVDAEKISKIELDWVSGKVNIRTHDDDTISFSETGYTDENSRMRYRVEDGTLSIRFCKSKLSLSLFKSVSKELTVYLPKSETGSFKIANVSADIDISDTLIDGLVLNNVSGDINISYAALNNLTIESVSGDMDFSGITSNDFSVDSVSGNIDFAGAFGKVDIDSVSGNVRLESSECPKEVDINTVSGDIRLTVPEDSDFTADLSSVSGKLSSDFSGEIIKNKLVCGSGRYEFDLETVSGNAQINKLK